MMSQLDMLWEKQMDTSERLGNQVNGEKKVY